LRVGPGLLDGRLGLQGGVLVGRSRSLLVAEVGLPLQLDEEVRRVVEVLVERLVGS